MTLISIFDPDPLDNISDIIYFNPDKCIFIGESPTLSKKERRRINRFLDHRGMKTAIEYHCIPNGDLDEATNRMTRVVQDNPDCIFDVSGGTEMLLQLAGRMTEMFDIPIYQRKGPGSNILWQRDCFMNPGKVSLTVEEVVALHSGIVLDAVSAPKAGEPLYRHIPKLWEIARRDPDNYNRLCGALSYLVAHNEAEETLALRVSEVTLNFCIDKLDRSMLEAMAEADLVRDLHIGTDGLSLTFPDYDIKATFLKAGNLLEMVTCLAASTFADDCAMGVVMDWDGHVDEDMTDDTTNELDGMLTLGLQPVCISCKNGKIDKEALYELDTVSRHFGGNFAKRILVATYVNTKASTTEAVIRRAEDMNILLLHHAHHYSYPEFVEKLKSYCLP